MKGVNIIRRSAVTAVIGIAALVAGTASAYAAQNFGRSSVYAGAPSTTAPKPVDGVSVTGNGRGSVYAVASRATAKSVNLPSRARTIPGNGRGSIFARTNDAARS